MRYLVNRTAIHVLSQNHRIRDKMLHACTSRGATWTVKQGRIVQTQNFIFGRFSNFFYYPNGTWTHPHTSKLFLDFWNFFNFAKPLRLLQKKAIRTISNTDYLAHSSKLFFNLKLLKLDDIMKFQLGTFMYKLKYNKLPNVIPHYVRH